MLAFSFFFPPDPRAQRVFFREFHVALEMSYPGVFAFRPSRSTNEQAVDLQGWNTLHLSHHLLGWKGEGLVRKRAASSGNGILRERCRLAEQQQQQQQQWRGSRLLVSNFLVLRPLRGGHLLM